jgi:hypothetical protein
MTVLDEIIPPPQNVCYGNSERSLFLAKYRQIRLKNRNRISYPEHHGLVPQSVNVCEAFD